MSGEQLHSMYRQALAEQGVESDEWEQLDETDKAAWNLVAERLV